MRRRLLSNRKLEIFATSPLKIYVDKDSNMDKLPLELSPGSTLYVKISDKDNNTTPNSYSVQRGESVVNNKNVFVYTLVANDINDCIKELNLTDLNQKVYISFFADSKIPGGIAGNSNIYDIKFNSGLTIIGAPEGYEMSVEDFISGSEIKNAYCVYGYYEHNNHNSSTVLSNKGGFVEDTIYWSHASFNLSSTTNSSAISKIDPTSFGSTLVQLNKDPYGEQTVNVTFNKNDSSNERTFGYQAVYKSGLNNLITLNISHTQGGTNTGGGTTPSEDVFILYFSFVGVYDFETVNSQWYYNNSKITENHSLKYKCYINLNGFNAGEMQFNSESWSTSKYLSDQTENNHKFIFMEGWNEELNFYISTNNNTGYTYWTCKTPLGDLPTRNMIYRWKLDGDSEYKIIFDFDGSSDPENNSGLIPGGQLPLG